MARRKKPSVRGRRPGTNNTRETILDAARSCFAKNGFVSATIRKIAESAGVDASLVMQFFRTKQELFGAVMSLSPHSLSSFAAAFDGPKASLGERVTRAFFDMWERDSPNAQPMLAMLRSAISSEQATVQLREFLQVRLTAALGAENALRVGIASSMLVGLVVGRDIVQVPALFQADTELLVALISPAVQTILTIDRPRRRQLRRENAGRS